MGIGSGGLQSTQANVLKRQTTMAQRVGSNGNPKVKVKGAQGSQASQPGGASVSGGGSFVPGADLWAEIAAQAALDNSENVGKMKDRISYSGGKISRGRNAFDVAKLTKELGLDICLPVAIGTSKVAAHNVVFCDKKGKPGHEHDGKAHLGLESWAREFNDHSTGPSFRADFV